MFGSQIEIFFRKASCLIEALMEDLKPVVTEKYEIKHGDESKLIATLKTSDYQNSKARIKTIDVLNEYSNKCLELLHETSQEELKL